MKTTKTKTEITNITATKAQEWAIKKWSFKPAKYKIKNLMKERGVSAFSAVSVLYRESLANA